MMLLDQILPIHLGGHWLDSAAQAVESQAVNTGEQAALAPLDAERVGFEIWDLGFRIGGFFLTPDS